MTNRKVMTDAAGRPYVRVHGCFPCKHQWVEQVVLGDHATNLSGELRSYCPLCKKSANHSSAAILLEKSVMPAGEKMPCPVCDAEHAAGPHGPTDRLSPSGGAYYNAPDVACACGQTLRYTVPIFMVHPHGWEWRVVTPKQKAKDAEDHALGLAVLAKKAKG